MRLVENCSRCRSRVKDWTGDDAKCAFPNGTFSADGWNCATANALRDLLDRDDGMGMRLRYDDESWGALNVIGIKFPRDHYKTLWLSWYKGRGRTDQILLLSDHGSESADLADCELILAYYESKNVSLLEVN